MSFTVESLTVSDSLPESVSRTAGHRNLPTIQPDPGQFGPIAPALCGNGLG